MKYPRPLAAGLGLLLISASARSGDSVSSQEATPIAVAGLLGGSTLVPLGQFVSGRWVRTWPEPGEQVDRKLARVEDIPRAWYPIQGGMPKEWFVWTEGAHGVPMRVGSPKLAESHCETVWGLSTRLLPFDHETTAIATSVRTGIRPFGQRTLGATGDEHITTFLRDQFEKAEIAAVRIGRKDADLVLKGRPTSDPVYELSCVNTGKEDDQICSFEASRRLGTKPPDPGCDEVMVVQGWYKLSVDSVTLLQVSGLLTDCDAKDLRTVTPMLFIDAGTRSFVVVREHGYEDESFTVIEVWGNELRQALSVAGGGC